jgi:hypothetical protein
MTKISNCNINGVDATTIQIQHGRVSAEVGFLIDSKPFGLAQVAGLDEDVEVRDAADALQAAVESAVAKRLGSSVDSATSTPRGLLDPTL